MKQQQILTSFPASKPQTGRKKWISSPGEGVPAQPRRSRVRAFGAASRGSQAPRIPRGRWAGPWAARLPGQGVHAGRPCCRRLGVKALAARALLHGAARAAGGKGRSDLRGCRAGGAEGGVRRALAAVRPAPAREGDRKRPCSPRLHRARGLPGSARSLRAPRTPAPLGRGEREVTAPAVSGSARREGRRACGRRGHFRNRGVTRVSRKEQDLKDGDNGDRNVKVKGCERTC